MGPLKIDCIFTLLRFHFPLYQHLATPLSVQSYLLFLYFGIVLVFCVEIHICHNFKENILLIRNLTTFEKWNWIYFVSVLVIYYWIGDSHENSERSKLLDISICDHCSLSVSNSSANVSFLPYDVNYQCRFWKKQDVMSLNFWKWKIILKL